MVGGALWAAYLAGAIAFSCWTLLRTRSHITVNDRLCFFAILTALGGVALHASMDYPLQVASIQLYVVVLTAMLWSSRAWIRRSNVLTRLEKRLGPAPQGLAS